MPRRGSAARRADPRGRPAASRSGSATPLTDSVDRIVAEWAVERPDLPVATTEVLTRLSRVRTRVEEELAGVFDRYDLSLADFTVIAALRRAGAPFTLPQSVLMARLGLTSGTMSVRLGRLAGRGVVSRTPSSEDGRGVLVTLTEKGAMLFDEVAPQHLANEELLLSALSDDERRQLAALLRKLLVAFEHEQSTSSLGFTVSPAHLARRARAAVGLSDRAGLLVRHVEPASRAEAAGLHPGDVLTSVDDEPLRCCLDLAAACAAAIADGHPLRLQVLHGEQERRVVLAPTPARAPASR